MGGKPISEEIVFSNSLKYNDIDARKSDLILPTALIIPK